MLRYLAVSPWWHQEEIPANYINRWSLNIELPQDRRHLYVLKGLGHKLYLTRLDQILWEIPWPEELNSLDKGSQPGKP